MTDSTHDSALRPQRFADYIGQPHVTAQLQVATQAAKLRGECVEHVLIDGPPGLGKTTLAHIIANESGGKVHTLNAASVKGDPLDFCGLFNHVAAGDVLFIDEIHRLSPTVEEFLYPAMEDFKVDFIIGDGDYARAWTQALPRFALVGATTMPGLITPPMRARFGLQFTLRPYDKASIATIISTNASKLGVNIESVAVDMLAGVCRGTPRIANRLLRRCRDLSAVNGGGLITSVVVGDTLAMLDIDALGLDTRDRKYLGAIIDRHNGGPVGVEAVAGGIGEDAVSLIQIAEPYLLSIGFLVRTRRGREATPAAYKHLGRDLRGGKSFDLPDANAVSESSAMAMLRSVS